MESGLRSITLCKPTSMSFRLYYVFILACFTAGPRLMAQNFDWPAIIFQDTTNFNGVKIFEYSLPAKYVLLRQIDCWPASLLHTDEDISDPAVRQRLANTEHHPYQLYLFKARALDTLVTMKERNYLYQASQKLKIPVIPPNPSLYELTDTSHTLSPGFYYSLTPPLFSSDGRFAYINLNIYLKYGPWEESEKFPQPDPYPYISSVTTLVYRYSTEKGWVKFYQRDFPIL